MQDFADPWQRGQKHSRDLSAPKITRSEDEHSGLARSQRGDLKRTVTEPLILGEYNPAALADGPKPYAVFLITREMVVMKLNDETSVDKFRSDWFYAQRP